MAAVQVVDIRPLRSADDAAVRGLFRDTLAFGRPVTFAFSAYRRYEALCLDWYLQPARLREHAVLVDASGRVVGYALVCVEPGAYARWTRLAALRWTATTVAALAARRFAAAEATFHRLRLADGWTTWRHAPDPPQPAHAHINLARSVRGRLHIAKLIAHVDRRCAVAGQPGWYGEINAPPGRRAAALTAHGATVAHRQRNRTLSWLCAREIERMTVNRALAAARTR